MNRFFIPVLTAAFALLVLAPSTGTAQSPDEYQVAVSLSAINLPVFQPGVPNLGAALKTITAKANDQTCTTATIAGATADVVLHIGGAGQPAACSLDGAKVTLIDGNGHTLFVSFTLTRGTRDTLSNLAPVPPSEPGPGRQEPPVNSGEFQVLVAAASMQLVFPVDPAPPEVQTFGTRIGTLSVLANGAVCVSLDVTNLQQDALLRLGLPEQPPACVLEGATVTFTNARGEALMGSMTLRLGARETLRSFSPPIVPPIQGSSVPGELAAAGEFQIFIAASLVNQGGANSPGARFKTLTGLANGTACTTVDISAVSDDVVLRFGLPGQPEVCGLDGATLTLRIGEGTLLVGSWVLRTGTQVSLVRQFAVRPPVDGPGPSRLGITPPDTGDGGLR